MDIVVVDIPPKYGMLLSRSWGAKLQGSFQLDMSYATIPIFGQPKKLFKETLTKHVVSNQESHKISPSTQYTLIWILLLFTMNKLALKIL